MFRIAAVRGARAFALRAARPTLLPPARFQRFESTLPESEKRTPEKRTPEELLKAAQDLRDELQKDWDAKVLTYEELLPKTQSPSPDSYLIDVREPEEVVQGMIPSAVNLPLSVLANSLHLAPDVFKAKHGFEKPKKGQELTFYCRSGMRSTSASDVAKRNGYTNVLNYKGSWLEWVGKGGEMAK
ncbi:endoplasmic reticulum protein [Mycena belliarum]|uniref:Endoplasmic reticulum protein n=1 Tax=Mycena belliarum TaxID=1033014 RepID=A0AAD6UJ15_9AGAR|nr:endoplasmic reticulum protein [Mycena belliae]